jgi:hypothetical protein
MHNGILIIPNRDLMTYDPSYVTEKLSLSNQIIVIVKNTIIDCIFE